MLFLHGGEPLAAKTVSVEAVAGTDLRPAAVDRARDWCAWSRRDFDRVGAFSGGIDRSRDIIIGRPIDYIRIAEGRRLDTGRLVAGNSAVRPAMDCRPMHRESRRIQRRICPRKRDDVIAAERQKARGSWRRADWWHEVIFNPQRDWLQIKGRPTARIPVLE